jgi:hypothetical protein
MMGGTDVIFGAAFIVAGPMSRQVPSASEKKEEVGFIL